MLDTYLLKKKTVLMPGFMLTVSVSIRWMFWNAVFLIVEAALSFSIRFPWYNILYSRWTEPNHLSWKRNSSRHQLSLKQHNLLLFPCTWGSLTQLVFHSWPFADCKNLKEPEDWLEYIQHVKENVEFPNDLTQHKVLSDLFDKAFQVIFDDIQLFQDFYNWFYFSFCLI